jgi:hypothetical protein
LLLDGRLLRPELPPAFHFPYGNVRVSHPAALASKSRVKAATGLEVGLSIQVTKISDDLYYVSALTPPWKGGELWSPAEPLSGLQLVEELTDRGIAMTDICGAMEQQDPLWVEKSRDPNVPRIPPR